MSWFSSFYRTAVGKKAVMAVTGVILWGFVLLHMLGNLKLFEGRVGFNHYAEWLRVMGAPAVPHMAALWALRLVLLLAVGFHILATVQLTRMNWQARPEKYRRRDGVQLDLPSRTMRWSGGVIVVFIVYHLLHFTTGTLHPDFVPGDVYHNVVSAFHHGWVAFIYGAVMLLLGLHLYHGLWSFFQSLGWNHPRYNAWRRVFAVVFAILVAVGFLVVPVVVFTGLYP